MNVFVKPSNTNPKGRRTCDCVVRAISYALNMDWATTLRELTDHAIATGYFPADSKCYVSYLETKGIYKQKCPKTPEGKRYSVRDVPTTSSFAILKVSGHLTVIDSGTIRDTWDCSKKKVFAVYQK